MTRLDSRWCASLACALMCFALLGGCASTGNPRDPFEPLNRGMYHFNDGVDNLVLKPAAEVYRGVLPQFVRTGVSNFFSNINDVVVALNNLLQGKFLNAVSDVGRIVVNTTAGLLGVIDVATEIGLEKHNEDFGQTLGFWGMGSGPYLVLPFVGPSTMRDAVGLLVDFKTDPVTYVDPSRDRNILWGTRFVNRRAELLDTSRILETAALDPYEFLRDAYLQRRRNLVHDGSPPPEDDEVPEIKVKPRSEGPGDGVFPPVTDAGNPVEPVPGATAGPTTSVSETTRQPDPPPSAAQPPEPSATPSPPRMVRVWTSESWQR